MGYDYDGGWPRYVPVAERRRKAEREMKKLRKKGYTVSPVTIEGRGIAKSFWGKAWCGNLESYRDYESRLPRGRTYARNGSVIDLQIAPLTIKAMVSGSSIYQVDIDIKALAPAVWRSICSDCAGGIDSLVELLQGRFSKGVMERLCRQDKGLFPKPSEIRFSCSCPDGASMCKHVAAALYGVGARLDDMPELLFRLRAVDENDLTSDLGEALPLSKQPTDAVCILATDDMSGLFGIDLDEGAGEVCTMPESLERGAQAGRKPTSGDKARKSAKLAKSGGSTRRNSPSAKPASRPKLESKGRSRTRKSPKAGYELTPDGYVIWWK